MEALGGIQYIQSATEFYQNYSNSVGPSSEYIIDGMQNVNLKLGLSLRFSHRLLYALDDHITPVGRDLRYFAMVLLPLSQSFSTDVEVPDAILATHDQDMANIGFTAGVQWRGFVFNGLSSTTRISISQIPNLMGAGFLFSGSYIIGFGPNSAKTYLED